MKKPIQNLTLSAMFVALAMVLPLLTGQIPQIGGMMLPMHIPVLLCGLICGWQYGGVVGLISPMLRHMIFGMPPILTAVGMSFELLTYGLVVGLLYSRSRWQCVISLYRSLILAMVAGRVVWGLVEIPLLGVFADGFTFQAFLAGALLNAVPGIILQLILIPALMVALNRTGLVPFHKHQKAAVPVERER